MFNGTPNIQQISPTELRITGVTLSANTAGTIGFAETSGPGPDHDHQNSPGATVNVG
jgi:hypothetical protein